MTASAWGCGGDPTAAHHVGQGGRCEKCGDQVTQYNPSGQRRAPRRQAPPSRPQPAASAPVRYERGEGPDEPPRPQAARLTLAVAELPAMVACEECGGQIPEHRQPRWCLRCGWYPEREQHEAVRPPPPKAPRRTRRKAKR